MVNNLNSLFNSNSTSAKLYKIKKGTIRRYEDNTDDIVVEVPHNLKNDILFVTGFIKVTANDFPGEVYYFGLPWINALGWDLFTATWDKDKIYIEWPWDGSSGDPSIYTEIQYTVMAIIA